MKVRLILGAALAAVLALGVTSAGFSAGHHRTPTITGMVGGDFDTQLPPGGQNGADWGVDASFPRAASNVIHDGDVKVKSKTKVNGHTKAKSKTKVDQHDDGSVTVKQKEKDK